MHKLSVDDRAVITTYAARASWPSGFQIYERGMPADGVFVVTRGCVALRNDGRTGRRFVPCIATPGETFGAEGLAPGGVYSTDANAADASDTLFVSSAKLRAFLREQPASAMALVSQIMAERAALLDKLREVTTMSVEQRLVAALRRIHAYDGFCTEDGRIELCASRYRLLCELVGATRESVSLVMGKLVGEGVANRVGNTLYLEPGAALYDRLRGTHGLDVGLGPLEGASKVADVRSNAAVGRCETVSH